MEFLGLVSDVADKTKYTRKEIRLILRLTAQIIREELIGGRDVNWQGLGKFINCAFQQRVGGDPRTGKRIIIPPSRRIRFHPSCRVMRKVKKSIKLYEKLDPIKQFLPKGINNGEIRSRDRSGESSEGEDSWEDIVFEREYKHTHRSGKG